MNEHVDGNALAGPLAEIFRMDVTTVVARCLHCGDSAMLAQAMVFFSAPGTVVRCATCGEALATLVDEDGMLVLGLAGISALSIPRA
jgi:ribosomal protein S27E